MSKAPTNSSLSWETLAALSPFAVLWSLYTNFGPMMGATMSFPSPTKIIAYLMLTGCGIGGMVITHDYISSLPHRRLKVAFENCKIYIEREAGIRLPRLKARERKPWGWRFFYKLPIGLCKADLENMREEIEAALDAEVSFNWHKGLIRIDVLTGKIPVKVNFKPPEEMRGEIPFTVGKGREGLITADLASCPHLLVAGQTGAGKSNFLHQMIACLVGKVQLHIIDLKQVEFAYMEQAANVEHTLDGAIKTLEYLTKEMQKRMAFLSKQKFVSAKEWRAAHPEKAEELPYMVLVVDEFSQLSPVLSKDPDDKKVRSYAHKMLVDLICLARSLGIHLVLATQRPDRDILPGQLKANIPATICFKVRNQANSQICLDNDRATELPSPSEIPGRAIWQHDDEREVQTLFLPMAAAREIAFTSFLFPLPPPPPDNFPGRILTGESDT